MSPKSILSVIYEFLLKARAFLPGKRFQPRLLFVGKASSYPRVEQLKGSSNIGYAVKASQGQTL